MALTFRPFAETPKVEELTRELEAPRPPAAPSRQQIDAGTAMKLGGGFVMSLALFRKGWRRWGMLLAGWILLALGRRAR